MLSQEKERALSHREAVLKENDRIFAAQYLIDWQAVSQGLDLEKQSANYLEGEK